MTKDDQERREQELKQRAVDLGLKLIRSADTYVLLTETDAPIVTGTMADVDAKLGELQRNSEND